MDQFFQTLRTIQKKERKSSTLARVDETFYQDIHRYLADLRKSASNDFFSDEFNLIKDTQRVATEICERREHKITDAAVVNIQRSYHLFAGKPKFDLVDTTPLNLTPEEEEFYFALIDALKNHRNGISISDFTGNDDEDSSEEIDEPTEDNSIDVDDDALNHLNKISKAKVIKDEKREPLEKQIKKIEDEEFRILHEEKDEFVDLESKKISKETELVNLLVFDNTDAIMGVDEGCYGPFYPQDVVVLPKINAMVFVKQHKGRILKI